MKPILTLLEGKWFKDKHVSVRDLFSPLFTVWTEQPHASFHYEQFTNEAAFRSAVKYAFESHKADVIYIGAHGDRSQIHGFHDEGIKRTVIKNALSDTSSNTHRGLYFGSCSFVNEDTANFILPHCPRVAWLAGYDTEVDWFDSSALDLCFIRHLLFPTPGKGNKRPVKLMQRVQYAAQRIQTDMGPLAKRLGFHVFICTRGKIIDLMEPDAG